MTTRNFNDLHTVLCNQSRDIVVEAAVPEQPEVGHPDLPGGRCVAGGRLTRPLRSRSGARR